MYNLSRLASWFCREMLDLIYHYYFSKKKEKKVLKILLKFHKKGFLCGTSMVATWSHEYGPYIRNYFESGPQCDAVCLSKYEYKATSRKNAYLSMNIKQLVVKTHTISIHKQWLGAFYI